MSSADVWITFRLAIPTGVYMSEESAMQAKFHGEAIVRYAPADAIAAAPLHVVETSREAA
jgi:hypothetical protein